MGKAPAALLWLSRAAVCRLPSLPWALSRRWDDWLGLLHVRRDDVQQPRVRTVRTVLPPYRLPDGDEQPKALVVTYDRNRSETSLRTASAPLAPFPASRSPGCLEEEWEWRSNVRRRSERRGGNCSGRSSLGASAGGTIGVDVPLFGGVSLSAPRPPRLVCGIILMACNLNAVPGRPFDRLPRGTESIALPRPGATDSRRRGPAGSRKGE
ncbi:hypothetical protein THAOC_33609 [Thalassiosira oceanica]|uniref:Secreted protein n=1 Tax=Thalassiosira oceanica TaxID=159749 RepID=K0RF70_THAOC|nr:hypothetical protein THAOC_33609 [Thalassiosira oceanica]|eukprot:EJK47656.1 hypothetical protein THAOC_33609 [Thalassiosira oceanica]